MTFHDTNIAPSCIILQEESPGLTYERGYLLRVRLPYALLLHVYKVTIAEFFHHQLVYKFLIYSYLYNNSVLSRNPDFASGKTDHFSRKPVCKPVRVLTRTAARTTKIRSAFETRKGVDRGGAHSRREPLFIDDLG
jgi:hypothetical protein